MQSRRCEWCGDEFKPRRREQRFCSGSCAATWTARKRGQVGRVSGECPQCGKGFDTYAGNNRKYCSEECGHLAARTERPKCLVCGKPVRLMRNRYCSKSCSVAARDRPGVTSLSGFYLRAQRANPEPEPCAVCGGTGKHRHHRDYSKPEQIVWLCAGCHRRTHQEGIPKSEWKVCPAKVRIP